jgi:ATP-dependent Clp protease, protease subunit
LLYGDIVMDEWGKWTNDDKCPSEIIDALNGADGKPVTVRINSGGGSVFGGMAIYNALKSYRGAKTVYVDGVAASIASVIMLAGDEIHIPKNAYVMIHKPWGYAAGNAIEMRDYADSLDTCEKGMMAVYGGRLKDGATLDEIADAMASGKEMWRTGDEISSVFNVICDEPVQAVACASDCKNHYENAPDGIAKARAEPAPSDITEATDCALECANAYLYCQNEIFGGN